MGAPNAPTEKSKVPSKFLHPGKIQQSHSQTIISLENWKYPVTYQHPFYATTSSVYGKKCPTINEMPKNFYSTSRKFSEVQTMLFN